MDECCPWSVDVLRARIGPCRETSFNSSKFEVVQMYLALHQIL